ncbi:WD repeat-containing protein 73 [Coregonus clupeaformis]|uniref:WD repeat-containing protein 73 n=1 Tax=Coregonus clupeaformis TaxID=59861 RepID=UPI001BE0F4A5|nr:WD repeat-containing protein 73 [Coregonus clupeaformis]
MGETSSDENEFDDWFIESLKIYNNIHEYQLEHPTRVIEWTSEKTICVAGYSSDKNEILELLLPLKLFADDNQGLCAERDFKVVHGGFSDGSVHCLKHIPGTRCVVTNDGFSSNVQVWDLGGDDCDVIKRTGVLQLKSASSDKGVKIAPGLTGGPCVLHGSRISDIQLTELASGKPFYSLGTDIPDLLSSLQFVSASVFLACACNGDLYVGDTRKPSALQNTPAEGREGVHWCMGVKTDLSSSDPSSCSVARLSSSCQVVVSDLRDLRAPVCQAQLDVQRKTTNDDFMNVTWAPALDNCLAVSGFDGMVQIYNTASWRPELMEFQPLFVHRGHMMSDDQFDTSSAVVTTHVWHPSRPRTVLSAAVDGSVHVWDWVHKATASC